VNAPDETRRTVLNHATLALSFAALVAVYLSWPDLVQADRFHENWRQVPQWLSPDKQHFQEDDLLLAYAEFGASPFGNALYKTLALTGHDIVWGKIMTIFVFALGALTCFLAANAMSGMAAGWVAVVLFLFFPSMFELFVGGFGSAFSWPLLAFAVLLIHRQRWWWSIPLVAFSAITYPMVGLHVSMMLIVDTVYHDLRTGRLRDKEFWRTKVLPLALAAATLVAILGTKYFDDHSFGDLVGRAEMQDRIEFGRQGRYPILPTTALWIHFERNWADAFHLLMFVVAVSFLGRGTFRLPRGMYSLLVGSILMYYLSDYFVMQLYLPSRYVWRSIPLFTCLIGGIWWARIYADSLRHVSVTAPGVRRRILRSLAPLTAATIILAGLGVHEFAYVLEPGEHTRAFKRHGLYHAIRELPGRPMIAAWPTLASELPIMTGRTVLINKEQAHPWWTDYWKEVRERTHEFWRAYYTNDPDELKRVVDKYGIDYWVVEPNYYNARYIEHRDVHDEPFNDWLKNQQLWRSPGAILSQVPRKLRLYEDHHRYLVSSADVLRWLDQR